MTTHKAMMIAVATLGLLLSGTGPASAAQVRSSQGKSVVVPAGGYLYCKATVDNRWPVELVITLQDANGAAVETEFGSSLVASPAATGTGRYYIETSAGAFSEAQGPVAASCAASARGRFERGVVPQIEACGCDAEGCVCER